MSAPDVVLYLRTSDRSLVCIGPPGASFPPAMIADTLQMTISQEAWQTTYQPLYTALAAGKDLVVNADGSTTVIAHVLTAAEQSETTLLAPVHAFARHPAPSDAMKEAALRAIIRHLGLDS